MPRKRVHGTNVHDSSRAEWLAEKLGRRWRYDNVTGDWYGYDGVIWRLSRANAVAVDAMNVAAKHLSGCPEEGIERIDNESLRETIEKRTLFKPANSMPPEARDRCTTNICVVDSQGLAVSLIESISAPCGSGVLAAIFQVSSEPRD